MSVGIDCVPFVPVDNQVCMWCVENQLQKMSDPDEDVVRFVCQR